jgi:hypothetical protein
MSLFAGSRTRWGVRLTAVLALLVATALSARVALAAPVAQEGEPTPILLGQLAAASLLAGESAAFEIEAPDDGLYVLTSGSTDEEAANFTVVITDEDGAEVYNDVLQTAELELTEGDYIITATATNDGDVTLFLTGEFGELSEDWGEGELINGGFVTEEDIDGTRYAELEIEETDGWQQAFVVVTGGEEDSYTVSVSGDDTYESISDSANEPPLSFWTRGGDYTVDISPSEGGDLVTVVVLLGGAPDTVAVGEETELVLQPGAGEVAARFIVEEPNREYVVTLQGSDDVDAELAVSINPTQDTWSSYAGGTDETVTFVAPAAGEYFVRAFTSSEVEEPFVMSLLVEAGEEAFALVPGQQVWGEVEEGGRVVYTLPVEQENALVSILLVANNEQDLDLSAQQVGEDGRSTTSLSTYTSGATEIVAGTVSEPGAFQVTVSGEYASDDTPFVLLARVETPGDVGGQFAIEAEATSQFGDDGYAPVQATGSPNVLVASDNPLAWASKDPDAGEETLTLVYEHVVTPTGVRIFESYNPGAVVRIEAFDLDEEEWVVLWEGQELTDEPLRTFSPALDEAEFQTDQLRLTLDTAAVGGWNEIDAVELLGVP